MMMNDPKYVSIVMATLKRLSYGCTYSNNEIAVSKNGERILEILSDTEYRVSRNNLGDAEYEKIKNCCQDLQEAYSIYLRDDSLEKYGVPYFQKMSEFAGFILAVGLYKDNLFQYATWQLNHDKTGMEIGKYFDNYEMAKEDFAIRCGLVDRYKMFDETELKLIRQGLVHLGADYPHLTVEQMTMVGKVIEKIETIVPEIQEHEEKEHRGLVPDDELEL